MAWFRKLFLFAILSLLLIRCQQQSPDRAKVLDGFITVNESIAKVNSDETSIEYLYSTIHLNRKKNETMADRAGKLYAVTKEAYSYLEQVKQQLELKDTSLVAIALPGRPLIEAATADSIGEKLSSVYNQAYTALSDQQKKASLDSAMLIVKDIRTNQQWVLKWFDKIPTVAAITILSKFQNDCLDAARIALRDVKQHLDH